MQSRKFFWAVWSVIVLILLIWLGVWYLSPFHRGVSGAIMQAPQGEIISGFPASLLIDSSAQITASYAVAYGSNGTQYTTTWISSSSPRTLFAGYELYFPANGWRILNEATDTASALGAYAVSGSGNVNLTIVADGDGSQATLSYFKIAANDATLSAPALPASFPAYLNPGTSAVLISATSTGSGSIAIWASHDSVAVLVDSLKRTLISNQWSLLSDQESADSAFLIGDSNTGSASIAIQSMGDGTSQVQIRYLLK
jgi:hypothetical protein